MGRTKIGPFLSLLLHFLQIYSARADDCPSLPLKSLTCYNDYNRTISCVWNSSHHTNDACTLQAERKKTWNSYNASCELKPLDVSKPALKSCSLHFNTTYTFLSSHILSLHVNCMPSKKSEMVWYKPACHVKLNPPGQPNVNQTNVNQTNVSWSTQVTKHDRVDTFISELQWKQKNKPWNDLLVKEIECESCVAQLDTSLLIKDETYEARVRVKTNDPSLKGTWSDWSPTTSWVSQVGIPKPTSEWVNSVITLAALALLLTGIVIFMHKKKLIYVVKNFKGAPIPDPGKSEIFQDWCTLNSKGQEVSPASNPEKSAVQTWFSSYFTAECVQSFLSSVDIVSYEVTSTVDSMKFCRQDVKTMPESDKCNSSCSSFSNPSYSELCSSDCVPTVKLQASAVDAPYKPVQGQGEEQNNEHDSDVLAKKGLEMVKSLFMSGNKKKAVVISGYEKVEKQQAERHRLHSIDSGMCSCDEVSQESMEADSINMTDGHDEGTPNKEEKEDKEGSETKLDFQKLFGGSGNILGKNSIQICLDYKQIPRLQPERPEPPRQDSGISMIAEENERQEDGPEDDDKPSEMTCSLFPPHPPSTLPQQPLNISPFLPPLHGNDILKQIALSGSMLRQSCADGYLPVKQKES